MRIKKGLLGFGIGFGAAILAYEMLQKKHLSPRELTDRMMHATPGGGKIIGTWLSSIPETHSEIGAGTFFRGGVTVIKHYEKIQYEFLLDPKSGEILQVEQIFQ